MDESKTICKECHKPVVPEPLNEWLGKDYGAKAGYVAETCLECEKKKMLRFCAECGVELRGEEEKFGSGHIHLKSKAQDV